MKVFFVRHGEAMDDIENRYGGWYDPELSPAGMKSAEETAEKLKQKTSDVELILSSPLKRAFQTAKILSRELKIPIETLIYLKERNTYGLLCGENKDEAKEKYPELVMAYENREEVLGYEDYQFFLKRVKELIRRLAGYGKPLICVTHSKLLGALFKDILHREAKKFHDNCIAEIEIDNEGQVTLLSTEGIDLS